MVLLNGFVEAGAMMGSVVFLSRVIQLATKEGVPLNQITTRSSWGWKVASRPKNSYVASGCEDGSIAVHQLAFSTVHGLYHERYAYR